MNKLLVFRQNLDAKYSLLQIVMVCLIVMSLSQVLLKLLGELDVNTVSPLICIHNQ